MDSSRVFLAGRRCFFADGVPFLKLFGMSPHAGQNFDVRESVLVQCGVNLGDFLKANLTMKNELKDFEKIVYPLHVKVDKNFAIMRFASAEVTRDSTGVLVFKTKDFGPVKSMNQNLPLGSYEIVIKAIDSTTHYNITLCAEAISTASSPVMPKTVTFQNDYEMARNKTGKNPINHVVLSIPNRSTPHATSSAYEYIQSGSDRISDASQMYINTSANYLKLQNFHSSEQELSMTELIANLPNVDSAVFTQPPPPPPPIAKTITVLPDLKKQKLIQKVTPNQVKASEVPVPERKMKAFVLTVLQHTDVRWHFLWICDIMENAVFKTSPHELSLGHFFEGSFIKMPSGKWECTGYERPISPFIKGSIVYGRVELTTKVSNYHDASGEYKYPWADAKYLGTVIDRKFLLSSDCNGQRVRIQRQKLDDKEHGWVITELA